MFLITDPNGLPDLVKNNPSNSMQHREDKSQGQCTRQGNALNKIVNQKMHSQINNNDRKQIKFWGVGLSELPGGVFLVDIF